MRSAPRKIRLAAILPVMCVLAFASGLLFAHHSDAEFLTSKLVTLEGTVTSFEFVNPHHTIHFDVKRADGQVEHWVIYGGAPNHMIRAGWNSHMFHPGEHLTISGYPSKYGRKIMTHRKIVRANGEVVASQRDEEYRH